MTFFSDGFDEGRLDPGRWIDHYLPQWTEPERSRARWSLDDDGQPPWRADDGAMRVSNLQTATFAGPLGSTRGTHRHRPDLRVRTEVPTLRLWTPTDTDQANRRRGPLLGRGPSLSCWSSSPAGAYRDPPAPAARAADQAV